MLKYKWFLFALISGALCVMISCNPSKKNPKVLTVTEKTIEVLGKKASVYAITQEDGSYGLMLNEGDYFNVVVDNQIKYPTCLHWHGLILPNSQDGALGVTQLPIYPGQQYPYLFPIVQSGTYYMHSHFGMQEQKLLAAPLILKDPTENLANQDIVLMLNDFTFASPASILKNLQCPKQNKDKSSKQGPDLVDVNYDAFLVNYHTIDQPEMITVTPNTDVRIRIINGSSSTNFYLVLDQFKGSCIAVDGHFIEPIQDNRFEIGVGQRLDILARIPDQEFSGAILVQGEGTTMQGGAIIKTEQAKQIQLSSKLKAPTKPFSYAQERKLKAKTGLAQKPVDLKLKMVLGGDMSDYLWTINQQSWPNITPMLVKEGQRVQITFENTTTMAHPMHLHGHVFQVVAINGKTIVGAVRDTVVVLPNSSITVEFDANNPGDWLVHCHHLYHLKSGMATLIRYE